LDIAALHELAHISPAICRRRRLTLASASIFARAAAFASAWSFLSAIIAAVASATRSYST